MSKFKPKPVPKLQPGPGTAVTGPASGGSLLGTSNAPNAPSPWSQQGRRPYGGPQAVKGQPKMDPSGK